MKYEYTTVHHIYTCSTIVVPQPSILSCQQLVFGTLHCRRVISCNLAPIHQYLFEDLTTEFDILGYLVEWTQADCKVLQVTLKMTPFAYLPVVWNSFKVYFNCTRVSSSNVLLVLNISTKYHCTIVLLLLLLE